MFRSHALRAAALKRPVATFISDEGTDSASNPNTFSGMSFGSAFAGRKLVVGVSIKGGGTSRTITSVTIGGVTATDLVTSPTFSSGGNAYISALYIAEVPTGTSGDVVVTCSGSMGSLAVGLWSIKDLNSLTAENTNSFATGSGTVSDLTLTSNNTFGGCAIGSCWNNGTPVFVTWSGLTEDFDKRMQPTAGRSHSGASENFNAGGTKTITVTLTDIESRAGSSAFFSN